jgi:ophiobolin F synthase
MEAAFLEGARTGSIGSQNSGKRVIQALILKEMMAIDAERALTTMKGWAEFLRLAGGREHSKHFATLEEYIPYRSLDVGKWYATCEL